MSARHSRVASFAAVLVGVMVAVQSSINAGLAKQLIPGDGSATAAGIHAALISFATGLTMLSIGLLVVPRLRRGMRSIAAAVRDHRLASWQLLGGAGGAWLVATQGLTVPTLGVAMFIVAVVAGQAAASLGVDAAGLGPAGRLPVTPQRVIAALLAFAAVAVTAVPRMVGAGGSTAPLLALLVVSAGAGIAVQQALNGRVAVAATYPPAAAVVNFIVGTCALALVMLLGIGLTGWQAGPLPSNPLLYLGGPIGVAFIAIAAWAVPEIGVLGFALASICGQLLGAALIDIVSPQQGVAVGPELAIGIGLTVVAVLIGNRR